MVCLAGSLVFAALLPELRRAVRPIYIRVGILPSVKTGFRPATAAAPAADISAGRIIPEPSALIGTGRAAA